MWPMGRRPLGMAFDGTLRAVAIAMAALAALLMLAPVQGRAEVTTQTIQISDNWEASLGQKLSTQAYLRGGGPAGLDRNTASLILRVFEDVARAARAQKPLPYRVEVLSSSQIDGWSYPGGPVYITMGLLRAIDSVDELAGIFGHLLAHQVLGHHLSLLTEEGIEIAKKVAAGQIQPTKQAMGKPAVALLSEAFPTSMEKQADQLGASLAARAGYARGGLDLAHAKLARVSRSNPYFRTHPHPDVKPYSKPPSGIVIVPTPPPPSQPTPLTPPPSAVAPGEAGSRPVGPRIPAELGVFAGSFPFHTKEQYAELYYVDDYGTEYRFSVYQKGKALTPAVGSQACLFVTEDLAFSLTAGALLDPYVLGDGVRTYEPSEAGYVRIGAAKRLAGKGSALEVWLLGDGFGAWFSGNAGKVPPVGSSYYMKVGGHNIDLREEPITASAFNVGAGAGLRLDGPVFGLTALRWFISGRYQVAYGSQYVYTAKDFGGETVTIDFQNDTLQPFRASGASVEAGLSLRW